MSLDLELAEQSRWRLRPNFARLDWFNDLVRREFLTPEELAARQTASLRHMVAFAAARVPYYRELFRARGLTPEDMCGPGDLPLFPILTRSDVQDRAADLRPEKPGEKEKAYQRTKTSGSTGRPVSVYHSRKSMLAFGVLKQRELRWFRFDPAGLMATIRPPHDLPMGRDRRLVGKGETVRQGRWPQVGGWFETGPFVGFGNTNPIEGQAAWLREMRPQYLLMQSAELEHLAFAFQGGPPCADLRACIAISQQMTDDMRRRVERTFRVPVHQNYGLNEIGLIASRCPESGWYHVHAENSLVEIVDDQGKPCRPGQRGRILVTTLVNRTMPLIRYDADDLAEPVAGPCPCGRTLPSFTGLIGRYRRISLLPPGTWDQWIALQYALYFMAPELMKGLRQYQLHQFRDGRFALRVVAAEPLAPAFSETIREAWTKTGGESAPPLAIVEVDEIQRPPGGKFQNFTSDFAPLRETSESAPRGDA